MIDVLAVIAMILGAFWMAVFALLGAALGVRWVRRRVGRGRQVRAAVRGLDAEHEELIRGAR